MNDLIQQSTEIVQNNAGDIISDQEMIKLRMDIEKQLDENIKESMDTYALFKDMVANSGEFDSSQASKEQLAILLQTAQNGIKSKMSMLDAYLRVKTKFQTIKANKFQQNNIVLGENMSRRTLLQTIEQLVKEQKEVEQNEQEVQNITPTEVKVEEEFKIDSGEF
jgi:superfamily II DNA helicase RecQ